MQYMQNAPIVHQAPSIMPEQGATAPSGVRTVAEELRELARLRDEGILTAEEYEAKRGQLVGRM
jgi:hypothetical protein